MSLVAGMRLVGAMAGGTLSSASLTAAITPPLGLSAWKAIIHSPAQRSLLVGDKKVRSIWMESATAAAEVLQHPDAVRELFQNPDAITELVASSACLDVFWKSRVARFELWSNDYALDKFDRSELAMSRAEVSADLKREKIVLGGPAYKAGRVLCMGVKNAAFGGGLITFTGRRALSGVGRLSGGFVQGRVKLFFAADGEITVAWGGEVNSAELLMFTVD